MNKNALTFLLAIHLCLKLSAQVSVYGQKPDTVVLRLADYVVNNLQEKIYLITDKPYYTLGDTIWFQTCLVNAISHEPVTLSNTVYAELISSKGEVLESRILLADGGLAPGDFVIDAKWTPGRYLIRAYTKWMLNFPENYLFQKEVDVFHFWPEESAGDVERQDRIGVLSDSTKFQDTEPELNLRFFAEGGNLVPGFPAMIGVKTTVSGTDDGVMAKGKVLKAGANEVVARFECNQYGVGGFYLPAANSDFVIQLDSPDVTFRYEFPQVQSQSYGLKVINRFQAKSVHVMLETDIPGGLDGGFLIGHTRGQVFCVLALYGVGTIPRKMLSIDPALIPTGVAHFTFFDRDGVPQAERLIFMDHGDKVVEAKLTTSNEVFRKRERVDLNIHLPDSLSGNVSLSVTNSSVIVRDPNDESLASYLLLSSDLGGKVEDPGYYFSDQSKEKHQELDYLMLTHGWRRFVWEDVLGGDKDNSLSIVPEAGITLAGQLRNFTMRNKVETGVVQLVSMARSGRSVLSGFSMDETETDEEGRFVFNNIHYWDSVKFILQAKKTSESVRNRFLIELDHAEPLAVRPFEDVSGLSSGLVSALVEKRNREFIIEQSYGDQIIMLDEVTVETKSETSITQVVGGRYANPDYRLVADSLHGPKAYLIDILRQIPFVQFTATGSLSVRGKMPTVFLDGFELDGSMINDIIQSTPGHDIYFVDTDRTGFSTTKGNPAIYIYTKSGNGVAVSRENMETPGVLQVFHPGYYRAREFYAPDYDPALPKVVKPDYRIQLYWQSQVKLENGSANVSFYVGDDQEAFDVVIEGMAKNGTVIVAKKKIHVQK